MTWTRQRESGWIPMFPQKMTFLVHKHIVSGSVLSNWQKLCFIAENSQDLVLMVTRKISSFSLESSLSQLVNNAPALRSQVTRFRWPPGSGDLRWPPQVTSGDLRWPPRCCSPQVRSTTCALAANLSSDSFLQSTCVQLWTFVWNVSKTFSKECFTWHPPPGWSSSSWVGDQTPSSTLSGPTPETARPPLPNVGGPPKTAKDCF